MKKESVRLIFYQENGKVKVKLKNHYKKNAPDGVRNLHILLNSKITDILKDLK